MRLALRSVAVSCLLAIAVLSLLPGNLRPHTGASGNFEHILAFAGATFFVKLSWPRISFWPTVVLMFAISGLLELCQFLIPGRGPRLDNWLASTIGAAIGCAAAHWLLKLRR
ncbi:VanZ family protein [Zavarzinia compransoris]|uniref:VanZ-like domain-containing protein n=1 Tax=Zavarzinia compransoris TaxID=1264899 RepID=A0A317E4I6_9PROT|nr:hypothetical protein DKG75_05970 [Zavarzinia compransoris]